MGVPSSTLRKKISKSSRMGASASTSRKKITELDPVENSSSSSQINEMEPSEISYLIDGSLVYGREDDKTKITQLLLSDNFKSGNVTVICVVGANGIGKTTTVQLVYTDKSLEDAFDARIFIGMYERFDENRLMKGMLESLTGAQCDITEPHILENIVKDELMGKKVLLVLDSADNENKSFWVYLLALLNAAAKGSAVLVTTSRWEVAIVVGAMQCYQLGYLSDSNSWLIFEKLAFCVADQNGQTELLNIGKHLINKCASNTLCIKMLGGLLSRSVTVEWWRSVLEGFSSYLDEAEEMILPVLRVCYENLPSHLKRCFVYCSLFPKGYIFSKRYLARLWLAQGFIERVVGRDIEDVSFQCFEELCSRSFLHHSPLHNANDDNFIMHELVHDLAEYMSRNVCFRSEDCVQIIPKGVHHLSIVPFEYQTVALNLIMVEAKDLQSFLVISRFMSQLDGTLSPIIDLVGLNDLFVKLSSLKVLDLSNTDIEELPDSINVLRYLHYLGLNNTKIRSVPSEIRHLVDLQTLEAKFCYNLVELPESIGELTNIRHLDVTKEAGFVGMPVEIGKMTNLQSLATFNVGNDEMHCGIGELKHLEKLKGYLRICGLENVKSGLDAKKANLKSKHYLENLSLQWSDNTALTEEDEDVELQENILENLEPSKNLQELVIRNYVGGQFPLWIGDASISKLVSVILDCCPNCNEIPPLGALPALKYLSLQRLYSVDTMEVSKFPCLEVLNLWEMYELKEWPEIRNDDFPRLRTLSINRCPVLKSIPRFSSLVELSFHHCPQLPKFAELYSLETLNIEGLSKAKSICLPQDLIVLKKLEISHCGELFSLEGLSKLTSMEMLKIIECPKVDVGDWQPSKCGDRSKLAFEEELKLDNHDQDISETKDARQKDLPILDVQSKNEIEEMLAKEKLGKEILKQYIERLKQEIQILEGGQDKIFTDENKLELEQLITFCKHTTKELEVSLGLTRGHLFSLETDYKSLWLKEDHAVKEDDDVPHLKEHLIVSTSMPLASVFSKKELRKATENFSNSLKIGAGGFGSVYRGILGETTVAIKKLLTSSLRGQSEFKQEVDILSRVRHPNIVTLMGVCYDPPCIIYEHLPNGSLDMFLYGTNNSNTPPLSWQVRTRIIAEICSALIHLHSNKPPIVHRDLKPSNILLDANFVSKLTDFGISRIFDNSTDDHVTTTVMGTIGHVDPEYMRAGRLTLKSDIYSFGINILEIVTRKRALEMREDLGLRDVVEQAFISAGSQFFTLAGDWPFEQAKTLLQLGLRCADFDTNKRPDLVTEVWPIIRSVLRDASLSVRHCDQFSIKTMQGPNSSQMFQRFSNLKVAEWKKEIEEILVREGNEKDIIEEQIEELRQKMKLLERQQDAKFSKGKKLAVEVAEISSEGATEDLAVEEAEKLMKEREAVTAASYLPSVTEFSFQELEAATQNFSDAQKIGEGGFGPVYRGSLLYSTVAIKMLRSPSERGHSEFKQEVAILNKVRHPHLITLFGICSMPLCLIYEYLPNGSLEDRLACRNNTPPLPWQIRTRIIGEICSALIFLHSTNPHLVIHGDLKPGNILLDANLVCKLSDFGISHLIEDFHATTHTFHFYTQPKGTFAYMDPEFVSTGKMTPESDIYAFGIIILRLVIGKPPLGIARIVEEALEEDKMQSLIDTSAGEWPFEQVQILVKIGLRCASLRRRVRPDLVSEVWTSIEPLLNDASTS